MNGLTLMAVVIVCLWLGYHFYGRWLEKTWGIDPNAKTPAALRNDGKDYQPASRLSVFAHQFTSITGAGPVTGPIIAAMFGWLPALLWIIIGGIFFGAVQDFTALYASVRNGGKSMGMIIEQYVGRFGRQLFLAFCWLFTLLVIAAFADMIAATFNGFTKTGEQNMPNAAAASISMIYIVGAVIFGLFQKYVKPSSGLQLAVGITMMIAMLAMGIAWPIYADADTWRVVVFLYAFAASVMPMWILKQPRDFLSMFLLFGMIIAGVVGVFVTNPTINMPAFVGWEVKGLDLFPILFVTIACGAISGFHSLVSSGTSSKMIANETDMRPVGYGAMLVECVLGALALTIVCAAASTTGQLPSGTPFQLFSGAVAGFLTNTFGLPADISACVLTMCVSALAMTTVDAVARIGRMSFQELFATTDGREKGPVAKFLSNTWVSTLLTLGGGWFLCRLHEHLAALRLRQPAPRRPRPHRARRVPPEHGPQGLDAVGSDDRHVRRHDDGPRPGAPQDRRRLERRHLRLHDARSAGHHRHRAHRARAARRLPLRRPPLQGRQAGRNRRRQRSVMHRTSGPEHTGPVPGKAEAPAPQGAGASFRLIRIVRTQSGLSFRARVDRLAQVLAGPEDHDPACGGVDLLARARIAAHAALTVARCEGAEAPDLDAVAANQRVLHRMEDGAERVARLARRNVRKRVREFVCDFAARHHAAFGSVAHVSSLYVERSPYDIPSRRKTPSRRCATPPGLETAFDLAEAS